MLLARRRRAGGAGALLHSEGIDRHRRHQPDDRAPRRRRGRRADRAVHAGSTRRCRGARPGDRGESRGRRARQVRRALIGRADGRAADAGSTNVRRRSHVVRPQEPIMTQAAAGQGRRARRRTPFAPIEDAVAAIRAGQMIIVVDDEDRENEGDLTMAASKVTPEAINFMVKHGRGLVCLAMTPERLDGSRFRSRCPTTRRAARPRCACRSTRRPGTTTGISAADRARTIRAAIAPDDRAARSRAAGSRVSAARAAGRRAGARRPHRSGGRSGAHRRPRRRGRDLRSHERGRIDGARARTREVRAQARPADDHDRGPHPLSDADRDARAARRAGDAADRAGPVSRFTPTRA